MGMLFAQNDNTSLDKIQDAKPAPIVRRQGPPPKWRTTVVVWISLMATVMPWNYWVAPWLIKDLKVPIFWYLFIILIPVVVALKWFYSLAYTSLHISSKDIPVALLWSLASHFRLVSHASAPIRNNPTTSCAKYLHE